MYCKGGFVAVEHEKIFATECRCRDSHKGERKPNENVKKRNSSCRFCGVDFTSGVGRGSFENLFSSPGRVESAGLILAHCYGSIGFRLARNENLSERVCRPCGRKIRNAAELYSFIEKAVSITDVEEDSH